MPTKLSKLQENYPSNIVVLRARVSTLAQNNDNGLLMCQLIQDKKLSQCFTLEELLFKLLFCETNKLLKRFKAAMLNLADRAANSTEYASETLVQLKQRVCK